MKKILFLVITLFVIFIDISYANAIKIISRAEWGANEEYRYIDSTYWLDILEKRKSAVYTDAELKNFNKKSLKRKEKDNYLIQNFPEYLKLSEKISYIGDRKLAWPIEKSEKISAIFIHHTYSEYKSSIIGINNIYKYHSIIREWGDIGYNYVIGYDGEIYEGRAGGDYVVGAHAIYNNYSTVSISVMGNYEIKKINQKQYTSIKNLINHLVYKYDISLSNKMPVHTDCNSCGTPLNTEYYTPLVGHQDGGNTSCPGENLYNLIGSFKNSLIISQQKTSETLEKYSNIIDKASLEKLLIFKKSIILIKSEKLNSNKQKYILQNILKILNKKIIEKS